MYRMSLLALAATLAAAVTLANTNPVAAQDAGADSTAERAAQAADRGERAKLAPTRLPAGFKVKEQDDPILVRTTLESTTEAAISGSFDDVVERLVDQDRNRIGQFDDEKAADLKDAQRQIRDKWKAKYNKDFDLDKDRLFARLFVIQGEVEDPAVAIRNWPLPPAEPAVASREGRIGDDARPAGARTGADRPATDRPATDRPATDRPATDRPATDRPRADEPRRDVPDQANANIEKGRDVAVLVFPQSHNLPSLRVSMIQEAGGYKVDVPNSITGEQLHRQLAEHLRHISDQSAQWPADVNEAQLAVAHHVLAAIYGVQDSAQDAQPGARTGTNTGQQRDR